MTALVFVDSNVFLYALDVANPEKQRAARAWREELWNNRLGRISFQVLQEFYVNAARKWPENRSDARAEVKDLLAWQPVVVDGAVLELGWKLQDRYQLSFWDALIVAAAKFQDCRFLLSEDLQVNQDMDGVKVISPFLTEPAILHQ